MLPSSSRLRTQEVAEVLKRGRNLPSGTYLSAKFLGLEEVSNATIPKGTIRSAAVISKKIAKTAVARNRVRRAVYDSVRFTRKESPAISRASGHIVFFVRSIPTDSLQPAFTKDINQILRALTANR